MCGSLPLDEFLEQYYKDYPESLADLTIYQVPRASAAPLAYFLA